MGCAVLFYASLVREDARELERRRLVGRTGSVRERGHVGAVAHLEGSFQLGVCLCSSCCHSRRLLGAQGGCRA